MAELIGRPIARAEQIGAMFKLGVIYKTTEDMLSNLGLPPNCVDGNAGFPCACDRPKTLRASGQVAPTGTWSLGSRPRRLRASGRMVLSR